MDRTWPAMQIPGTIQFEEFKVGVEKLTFRFFSDIDTVAEILAIAESPWMGRAVRRYNDKRAEAKRLGDICPEFEDEMSCLLLVSLMVETFDENGKGKVRDGLLNEIEERYPGLLGSFPLTVDWEERTITLGPTILDKIELKAKDGSKGFTLKSGAKSAKQKAAFDFVFRELFLNLSLEQEKHKLQLRGCLIQLWIACEWYLRNLMKLYFSLRPNQLISPSSKLSVEELLNSSGSIVDALDHLIEKSAATFRQ